MYTPKDKIIEAYFEGGNAKDIKSPEDIKEMLEAILEVINEEEKKEKETRV